MASARRAPRARSSTTPDIRRLAKAVSHPGIDPRVWCVRGWVKAFRVDEAHGAFVDVTLQTGEDETAKVGEAYAGCGYGDHAPLELHDEVLLCAPMGNYNSGLVVVARLHSKSDPPAQEATDHPGDRLIRVKKDQTLRLVVDGGGSVVLKVKDGKVLLGAEESTLPVGRKTDPLSASTPMSTWAALIETTLTALCAAVSPTIPNPFATPATKFSGSTPTNPGGSGNLGTITSGSKTTESA